MEDEWELFLRKHKDARPFKNHGWIHLDIMTDIMPATLRGAYVYRPTQGIVGMDHGSVHEDDSDASDVELEPSKEVNSDESLVEVRLLIIHLCYFF